MYRRARYRPTHPNASTEARITTTLLIRPPTPAVIAYALSIYVPVPHESPAFALHGSSKSQRRQLAAVPILVVLLRQAVPVRVSPAAGARAADQWESDYPSEPQATSTSASGFLAAIISSVRAA